MGVHPRGVWIGLEWAYADQSALWLRRVSTGGFSRAEEEPPSTSVASSSWHQLPDGFLALSLADEETLGGISSAVGAAEGDPALAELPTLRLQVAPPTHPPTHPPVRSIQTGANMKALIYCSLR